MENRISIHYFIKKSNANSKGNVPIYMRITLNGKRMEFSTNRFVDPKGWQKGVGMSKGKKDDLEVLNVFLSSQKTKVYKAINKLDLSEMEIDADSIRTILYGAKPNGRTLVETIKYHNDRMKSLVGRDFAIGTYKRYVVTLGKVEAFLKHQYNRADIPLSALNHAFVTNFEFYLKTHDTLENNTAMKYIKNVKKIIHLALENEWIEKDPFMRFRCSYKDPQRPYLTKEELNVLTNKELTMPRLSLVRDSFIFSCYTGLAYSDIEQLTLDDMKIGIDGEKWITIYRKKTDTRSSIPLLPPALEIIAKYSNHPEVIKNSTLLPIISNQKSNAYLKEIATLCEIDKNLTFHIARHTFATTITLSNDVPIETVSRMLGHVSIKTTQIYSKVVDSKVSNDMKALKLRLGFQPLTSLIENAV